MPHGADIDIFTYMEKTVSCKHLCVGNYIYTYIYMEKTLFYADNCGLTFRHLSIWRKHCIYTHLHMEKHCINGDSYWLRKLYLWRQL